MNRTVEQKLFNAIRRTLPKFYLEDVQITAIVTECIAVCVAEKLCPGDDRLRLNLHRAEQQLYGWRQRQSGVGLTELVESMGLTEEEWQTIKSDFAIGYLNNYDIDEINNYFK